jgi:hypothetical protein
MINFKEEYNGIKQEIKTNRFSIFIALYLLFSVLSLHNIAHLLGFCYIIVLLENIIQKD